MALVNVYSLHSARLALRYASNLIFRFIYNSHPFPHRFHSFNHQYSVAICPYLKSVAEY